MSAGGSQKSLRKALGAIKDSTTVNLAKVNSDYKASEYFGIFPMIVSLMLVFDIHIYIYIFVVNL